MNFDRAQALFRNEKIRELSEDQDGLRFLKLRSLSRREYLEQLFQAADLTPASKGARALFREVFDASAISARLIDTVIRDIYETERSLRRAREPELVSQLYRLQMFDWGGLHQNSLEKTIVDNYVEKITDYDALAEKIDNELLCSMRGYVLCSWYNHWTSIIIEDVFRDHVAVLPALGQVKKIDFFIDDVPFDLKVTYLPEEFIKVRRHADGLRPELTLLRQSARRHNVHLDAGLAATRLLKELWAKLSDHPSQQARDLTGDLQNYQLDVVAQCQSDATELITWL